jgi:hypothetical protein
VIITATAYARWAQRARAKIVGPVATPKRSPGQLRTAPRTIAPGRAHRPKPQRLGNTCPRRRRQHQRGPPSLTPGSNRHHPTIGRLREISLVSASVRHHHLWVRDESEASAVPDPEYAVGTQLWSLARSMFRPIARESKHNTLSEHWRCSVRDVTAATNVERGRSMTASARTATGRAWDSTDGCEGTPFHARVRSDGGFPGTTPACNSASTKRPEP